MEDLSPAFLDVPTLLETSRPRPRVSWVWYGAGAFLFLMALSALAGAASPAAGRVIEAVSGLMMVALMASLPVATMLRLRGFRAEQQRVDGVAELVQLRCWPQAAALLEQFLSRPNRSNHLRTQALIYLAAVLARYHRFDDAIALQTYLIEEELPEDGGTAYGLRLGRTMAMLREDHLFDADRAIAELRRMSGPDSAGLALIEIYRDVKTGHPAEALAIFDEKLPILREQMGPRVADAHALAARAYDLLGREEEARAAWVRATLLAPVVELVRRYPEVGKLAERVAPAAAPPEAH